MNNIVITKKMIKEGKKMSEDLMDAHIKVVMRGLDITKSTFDEWKDSYKGKNLDLILKYINDEISSEEAIYIAMRRVKE